MGCDVRPWTVMVMAKVTVIRIAHIYVCTRVCDNLVIAQMTDHKKDY